VGTSDFIEGEWEQGWHSSDKLICPGCVREACLKAIVADAVLDGQLCDFCGSAPAADFDVFMEAFMVGVKNKFEQADDASMPWEGGYVFDSEIILGWDLPDQFDPLGAGEHDGEVIEEIRACLIIDKAYVSRWWIELEPEKAYSSAWEAFREQILHRTRFVFWALADTDEYLGAGEVAVSRVLGSIAALVEKFELITELPEGTFTYRARGHEQRDDSERWTAADLGTNRPKNSLSSTRMSPAGIPLFYGADDVETALAEISRADSREYFTVAHFMTTAPMKVLDFTHVPAVPSIFDPELGYWWGEIVFLNDLVEELRQPVEPHRSNLDYVPTQVFSEYFLRVFDEANVHGLLWKSAVEASGRGCVALDIPHEDCLDVAEGIADRPQLVLVSGQTTVHRRRTDEFRQL